MNLLRLMARHREIAAYVFWGVMTTVVTWLTYPLFVHFGFGLNTSNILSWFCGVTFAFVVNKWFVFQSKSTQKGTVLRELASFFGSRIFTGVIAWVSFPILLGIGLDMPLFGVDGFVAKILTSFVEIALNWVLS